MSTKLKECQTENQQLERRILEETKFKEDYQKQYTKAVSDLSNLESKATQDNQTLN